MGDKDASDEDASERDAVERAGIVVVGGANADVKSRTDAALVSGTSNPGRTTVTADRALMEARIGAQARRKLVDKVAAAVLLQTWLDSRAAQQ